MKSESQICEDLYSRYLRKHGLQLPFIKKIVDDIRVNTLAESLWTKHGDFAFYSVDGEHALKSEVLRKTLPIAA